MYADGKGDQIAQACGLGGGNRLRHRPSCKLGEDEKNQQSGEASGLAKPPLMALQAVEPVGRLSAWLRGGLGHRASGLEGNLLPLDANFFKKVALSIRNANHNFSPEFRAVNACDFRSSV